MLVFLPVLKTQEFPTHFSLGIHLSPINQAIIYQQLWPLHYTVPLPNLQYHSLNISCDPLKNSKTCAPLKLLINAMNNITHDLHNLRFHEEPDISTRTQRSLLPFIGTAMNYLFGTATTSQLQENRFNFQELKRHIQILEGNQQGMHSVLSNFSNAISHLASNSQLALKDVQNAITHIINNEQSIFQTIFSDVNHIRSFIELIIQIDTVSAHQTHYFISKFKFHQAINRCHQNLIPNTLISPELLEKDLLRLKSKLYSRSSTITPAFSVTNAYELPIVQCAVSKETLLVQINIPVIRSEPSWTLYKITTFPLASRNQTCEINLNATFSLVSRDHNIPLTSADLSECNISKRPFLCRVPAIHRPVSQFNKCMHAIRRSTVKGQLENVCPLSCTSRNTLSITNIDRDIYAIANPPTAVIIRSPNNTLHPVNTSGLYNLFMNIPCRHELLFNNIPTIIGAPICKLDSKPRIINVFHALSLTDPLFPLTLINTTYLPFNSTSTPLNFSDHIVPPILANTTDFTTTYWMNLFPSENMPVIQTSIVSLHLLLTIANTIVIIILYRKSIPNATPPVHHTHEHLPLAAQHF